MHLTKMQTGNTALLICRSIDKSREKMDLDTFMQFPFKHVSINKLIPAKSIHYKFKKVSPLLQLCGHMNAAL